MGERERECSRWAMRAGGMSKLVKSNEDDPKWPISVLHSSA